MADIQRYLNLITSQHKTKTKFNALLSAFLSKADDVAIAANSLNDDFDLDGAVGSQLDTIGDILGRKRLLTFQPTDSEDSPLLDDDTYRLVLKTKIAQNHWEGTTEQILAIWRNVFPTISIIFLDGQNMTVQVAVVGELTQLQKDLISHNYIIPKPQGVTMTFLYVTDVIFGYDLENDSFAGYDSGNWYSTT